MEISYSNEVLEATPVRVTRLLSGIGAVASIRTLMAGAGMTDADITEGRSLLLACLAAPLGTTAPADTDDARAQREATAELDQWDEPHFARYGAALRRRFPGAHDYVFRDLSAATGPAATLAVATFLQRVDALATGSDPARAADRAADTQAVALLASRGLDQAERTRLRGLVDVALGPTDPLPTIPGAPDDAAEDRVSRLVALKDWFEEWAATARAVVKRRSYLIRMGLASRRASRKPDGAFETPEDVRQRDAATD